ncbi:hypothetical protein [Jeotgalibacillus malaysiensis]|uniref:hypothetical protein n=1 Tax=Jeotgalibacillus malaysiensis TaxID=1508404 RepID=UPI00384DC6CF
MVDSYCSMCKAIHKNDELCPCYKVQLEKNPHLLGEAANFTSIAAQHHLISSQALDGVARSVNKIIGSNLAYEGTHQYVRDVQVFKQLNVDAFNKSGVFSSAEQAKQYINQATKGQLDNLTRKLNGTGQEIDWLRMKQEQVSSLFQKSNLLGEGMTNAPGVDGVTINRFTGEQISRTTIKAAQGTDGLGRNVNDVLKALKKGTLNPGDLVTGVNGTEKALDKALTQNIEKAINMGDIDYAEKLRQAKNQLKVSEINTHEGVKSSTGRLKDKMLSGDAHSTLTSQEIANKAFQGAVIGAAVGFTVSGIKNYLKFKNGEISREEAFKEVGVDSLKGAMVGSAVSTASLFIPGGAIGLVAGMAIGIYLNKTVSNLLDEIFGKGAALSILHSAGYIYGMSVNLHSYISRIQKDHIKITNDRKIIQEEIKKIDNNFTKFDDMMKRNV